jgi:hypothetical protein
MSTPIEINMPAGASEVTLKTAGKYCEKDIRVTSPSSFHTEHGKIQGGSEHITDFIKNGVVKGKNIAIPCSANPKLLIFKATKATQDKIVALTKEGTFTGNCTYALIFNNAIDVDEGGKQADSGRNCVVCQFLLYDTGSVFSTYSDTQMLNMDTKPNASVGTFYNEDDAEYEWTAYYWNE